MEVLPTPFTFPIFSQDSLVYRLQRSVGRAVAEDLLPHHLFCRAVTLASAIWRYCAALVPLLMIAAHLCLSF